MKLAKPVMHIKMSVSNAKLAIIFCSKPIASKRELKLTSYTKKLYSFTL